MGAKKQKTGSNRELVEQQVAELNQKLKECADKVMALQSEIESHDVLSIQHGKRSLELAIEAGATLIVAQDLIKYSDARWHKNGLWAKWVSENVTGITLRTVQNYMRIAAEAKRREEIIKRRGPTAKHVSLLDEAKSLREAYRAVGIIKRKLGANKDGEGDPRELTVDQFKRKHAAEYDERYEQECGKIQKTVKDIIADTKSLNWNLSEWKIIDDKPIPPNKETGELVNGLLHFIHCHLKHSGLTIEDEVYANAGNVFSELFKALIQANQKESVTTPETNRVSPLKRQKLETILRTINPFPLQPIPLEPMEAATPPVQTVQE